MVVAREKSLNSSIYGVNHVITKEVEKIGNKTVLCDVYFLETLEPSRLGTQNYGI